MSFVALRAVNPEGGIVGTRADGTEAYLDPGSDLHTIALSGVLGEIAPFVPPPPPDPAEALAAERARMMCSAFQARAALLAAGLLDDAEAAVAAAGGQVALAWEYAIEWKRNSPTIAALSAAIGLTPEQVDDLFRAAALIEA